MDDIAEIEKDSIPEYFSDQFPNKTPKVYKEYRNFMIELYRRNPQNYLTATSKKQCIDNYSM